MSTLGSILADWKQYRHIPLEEAPAKPRAPRPPKPKPFVEPVASAYALRKQVCEDHGVTPQEINGTVRCRVLINARRDLAIKLRAVGWSYPKIGRFMRKHHTSILNLMNKPERDVTQRQLDAFNAKRKPRRAATETEGVI